MILLAVDTSHAEGSLALARDGALIGQTVYRKKAMHSEVITLELQTLLQSAGLALEDITHLAVNVGPGSFTGLRVGVNLVRTLAYARAIPVATYNTLEILVRQESERVLVAIKAIQNFYYAAAYESGRECLAPTSMDDPQARARALNCTKVLVEGASKGFSARTSASDLVKMLGTHPAPSRFFTWEGVKPLYVRASEAEEKLKRGLLKPL